MQRKHLPGLDPAPFLLGTSKNTQVSSSWLYFGMEGGHVMWARRSPTPLSEGGHMGDPGPTQQDREDT